MPTASTPHEILELIHDIHNQLEIISGSAHLIGLGATLSARDRQDLVNIGQAVRAIAELTRSIRQKAVSPDQ